MKKLLVAILLMFSISANAGMKSSVGIENYDAVKESTRMCSTGYDGLTGQPYSTCSGYATKQRANALRATFGYELNLGSKYGVEANLGLNTLANGQAEVNGLYRVNDKITAKAGVNVSKDLNNHVLQNVKPGVGAQVGAEYKLTDKLGLLGTVGTKSQSYEIKGLTGERNDTSTVVNVGITFRF